MLKWLFCYFFSGADRTADMQINDDFDLTVAANGQVYWPHYGIIKISCALDMLLFPYDRQTCGFTFALAGSKLQNNIVNTNAIWSQTNNASWNMTSLTASHGNYDDMYPFFVFRAEIQRIPDPYVYTFIGPLAALSVLTFLTFFIPPDGGERLSVCLSCFVSFTVFIALVAEDIPSSSTGYPVIGE